MNLEAQILSSFLIDPIAVHFIPKLEVEDFIDTRNKTIFKTIQDLYTNNESVDSIIICDKHEELSGYIMSVMNEHVSSVNISAHVKRIKEKSTRSKLMGFVGEFIDGIHKENDITEIKSKLISQFSEIEDEYVIIGSKQVNKEWVTELEHRSKNDLYILKTGFGQLDNILYITAGKEIILAARPSVGKSALSTNIAMNMVRNGRNVLIFSLEMTPLQINERIMSLEARVDYDKIQAPKKLQKYDYKLITDNIKRVSEWPLWYCKRAGLTINDIIGLSKTMKAQGKCDIVIIDYLQLVKTDGRNFNKNDALGEITRSIKQAALNMEIPFLVLSQLNREIEKRDDKKPKLSDLRSSGEIENDADAVVFLHRELQETITDITIAKNRGGKLGEFQIDFFGEFQEFRERIKHEDQKIPYME